MDENLVGYLLNALEPDEHRQLEAQLRADPALRQKLQRLQLALEPLGSDLETVEPPNGLWVRTLGRLAEHQCQRLPSVPATVAFRSSAKRSWWRRADVAVAAGIFLCLTLLVPPGINYARHSYHISACQQNLNRFRVALANYSDLHSGDFPNIARAAAHPRNVAGLFVPMLRDAGVLGNDVLVSCPANAPRKALPHTVEELRTMPDKDFETVKSDLTTCYAYPLGYVADGVVHGPRIDSDECNSAIPLLADRPPFKVADGDPGNSPNHGQRGENVLYQGGNCRYVKTRHAGYDGDDIYLNRDLKVKAGKDRKDAVLAGSGSLP